MIKRNVRKLEKQVGIFTTDKKVTINISLKGKKIHVETTTQRVDKTSEGKPLITIRISGEQNE